MHGETSLEMPRYKCHKEVHALKIARIDWIPTEEPAPEEPLPTDTGESEPAAFLVPADRGYAPFPVTRSWMRRHNPQEGGYYVVYKDGYRSFSPAEAFEDGYTRI